MVSRQFWCVCECDKMRSFHRLALHVPIERSGLRKPADTELRQYWSRRSNRFKTHRVRRKLVSWMKPANFVQNNGPNSHFCLNCRNIFIIFKQIVTADKRSSICLDVRDNGMHLRPFDSILGDLFSLDLDQLKLTTDTMKLCAIFTKRTRDVSYRHFIDDMSLETKTLLSGQIVIGHGCVRTRKIKAIHWHW